MDYTGFYVLMSLHYVQHKLGNLRSVQVPNYYLQEYVFRYLAPAAFAFLPFTMPNRRATFLSLCITWLFLLLRPSPRPRPPPPSAAEDESGPPDVWWFPPRRLVHIEAPPTPLPALRDVPLGAKS